MLLLLPDPRIGLSLTLEAGISSRESAELIDVDGKRAIGFRGNPMYLMPSIWERQHGAANRAQAADGGLL